MIFSLDQRIVKAVIEWLTAIPFEDWGQQKPPGVYPLKPAMMSNDQWHGFGETFDPLVRSVMHYYPNCYAQQRMLSAVMPGDVIPEHVDQQDSNKYVIRIHVPLMTNHDSFFIVEGLAEHMQIGKAYEVDTRKRHAVVNYGRTPRVHFMFDVMKWQ